MRGATQYQLCTVWFDTVCTVFYYTKVMEPQKGNNIPIFN